MADYPTTPVNPGGGGIFWQRTDPSTWYLYNNPPPMPATTTTTLPPQADPGYGAAYAAPMADQGRLNGAEQAQVDAAQRAQQGMVGASQLAMVMPTLHEQYGALRGLDHLLRGGGDPSSSYPWLQSMIDAGLLYPGKGGVGLDMSIPYGGPNQPRTQRLIDAYEQYQEYLKGGGQPVYFPQPTNVPRYDPAQGTRILGTLP